MEHETIKNLNDKLDALDTKLDAHIQKVEPILEGLAASRIVMKLIKYVGGFLIGLLTLYTMLKAALPPR